VSQSNGFDAFRPLALFDMPVDDALDKEYQGGNGREGWRNF
jgi:hypothetical protein